MKPSNLFSMNIKSIIRTQGLFNILLVFLAAVLGADSAFAMAEVVVSTETAADQKTPDSKGDDTQIPGLGANISSEVESEFTEEEIDRTLAEFQAYQTPANASIMNLAEKVNVDAYEVTHYRTASPIFEVETVAQATASDSDRDEQEITLTIGTHIARKDAKNLYECKEILVKNVQGYTAEGDPAGMLACYVLKNEDAAGGDVVLKVLNALDGTATVLPAGSVLLIGGVAGAESQMNVAPDNFEPRPHKVYLQKRIFNIVFTLEFAEGKRKINFDENDLRQGALYKYKVGNEIIDLLGYPSKFKVKAGKDMQDEYVYTTEGVLRQINMYYAYEDDNLKATDLTAIAKMMFTKFSAHNEAVALMGQDFVEQLLNMDLTVHKEIKFEDVRYGGMSMKGWKNNFGTLNFVYAPVLDLIGLEKCAVIIDFRAARCYMKRSGKTYRVDMQKGVGDNREAIRDGYSQIYGTALRGYNSMIVGPSSELGSINVIPQSLINKARVYGDGSGESSLPVSGVAAGDVLYLTIDISPYKKGALIVKTESGWALYSGPVATV